MAIGSLVVSIFAFIASVVSITITVWWNRMRVTFSVCDSLYCKLIDSGVDDSLKPINPPDIENPTEYFRDHAAEVYQVLNLYEMTAQKVLKGYINEKIFKDFYYTLFTEAYKHLYPVMEVSKSSDPSRAKCYSNFKSLYERWTN